MKKNRFLERLKGKWEDDIGMEFKEIE